MKPLTRQEKKWVYEAAELIATDRYKFSCTALFYSFRSGSCILIRRYAAFYRQEAFAQWDIDKSAAIGHRLTLLLLFAEAAGDV